MQVSEILRRGRKSGAHSHWCPACSELHILPPSWKFNGDIEKPTFTPSFKHSWRQGGDEPAMKVCHYFITAGQILYCGDCTHAMSGQTVDIPSLPEDYRGDKFADDG